MTADYESLARCLAGSGIDLAAWGIGSYKSLRDLWHEVRVGEAAVTFEPLERRVNVVRIVIERRRRFLFEVEQAFKDGRRRRRMVFPSEKMRSGEDCFAAARRCLLEELECGEGDVRNVSFRSRERSVLIESPSYPGLPTNYQFFDVVADVPGLPHGRFWTVNRSGCDPIARHCWDWLNSPGPI